MTVTLVHPDGVNRVEVHHQVADTRGTRTVYVVDLVEVDAVAVLP